MKVALIGYGLDRPLLGIGRYTMELARAMAALENGPEVALFVAGKLETAAKLKGCSTRRLPGCRLAPGLVTLGSAELPLVARQAGVDIVHDPTGITPFLFGAGRVRSVVTVHDVFPWSCPGNNTFLDTFLYRYWLPHALPRVDAVVTDSRASKADISHYLDVPSEGIHVVQLAVNSIYRPSSEASISAMRRKRSLPPGYLLFVGSVEKRKNLVGLLHAYHRLRKRGEKRALVIVGARQRMYAEIMSTLEALDLGQCVLFTGYVPEADLPVLYSGADLFCFPSLYEGFGLPPLEAMACGTPVVCSSAASLPEVVGDAAIMVDPLDVDDLGAAMHRVLSDRALQEDLRARGLARSKLFTWERTARETVAVYRKVLEGRTV